MKKYIINGFIGLVALIALGILFMSYGNIKNHPTINRFIVEEFVKNNNKGEFSMPKFKNYRFRLNKTKIKGKFIIKSGLFNPSQLDNFKGDQLSNGELIGINPTYNEETRENTPKKWIEHGGYSADVPEVPASLRHFYDPTQTKGNRYLTDRINSKLMAKIQKKLGNPKTDGVEWAIGTKGSLGAEEHNYTWENGKVFMKGALEEPNLDKRNRYMAKAWRSLGETLHMIADNGCPAHVRNDGHPSIPFYLLSYFGNPDPYEEIMAVNSLMKFKNGKVSSSVVSKFRKAKTVRDIAHQMAVYTNKNFFTTETISGIDWKGNKIKQKTHPKYEYSSPKLNTLSYKNNYYRNNIAGQEVLMCTDTWFFKKYPIYRTYPYLDAECVMSQAKILIPTIKEAGVNTMKLFIPEIKVVITELKDDGSIAGVIIHKTDKEYKNEIKYNGQVRILTNYFSEITKLEATNGKFSGKINMEEGTKVMAEIEFGGVQVYSNEIKAKTKEEKKEPLKIDEVKIEVWFEAKIKSIDGENSETINKSEYMAILNPFTKPLAIKNNQILSVTSEIHDDPYTDVVENEKIERRVQLQFKDNDKFNSLNGFSFKRTLIDRNLGSESRISSKGQNIPFSVEYARNNFLQFTYKGNSSKYLTDLDFFVKGTNDDNTVWSQQLLNYKSPIEIKISLRFSKQMLNWNEIID